jgi:hypothetical protein
MKAKPKILPGETIKLRGVPQQGLGFFKVFYTMFRGKGIILNGDDVYTQIFQFFTVKSPMLLGCEDGEHIEAAVRSPTVTSMEALCTESSLSNIGSWSSSLMKALSTSDKDSSKFKIGLPDAISKQQDLPRDRDVIIHSLDVLFSAAPSPSSVAALENFLKDVEAVGHRLMLGGFYILSSPVTYEAIDLLLSAICFVAGPAMPLVYVGMIMAGRLVLWIFRNEPQIKALIESQKAVADNRLLRYPPVLQRVVRNREAGSEDLVSGAGPYDGVLDTLMTPTDTLRSLFRVANGTSPRETLNMLANFQPRYSGVIENIRAIKDPKTQSRAIVEMLYDLGLASQKTTGLKD